MPVLWVGLFGSQCYTGFMVENLLAQALSLWWETETSFPDLGRTYSPAEQSVREERLARVLDFLIAELKQPPHNKSERDAAEARITRVLTDFAKSTLELQDRHLDVLLRRGLIESARELAHRARQFDSHISGDDIFQASRNAWTMHGVQMMLGLPARVTPSVFAYSMLYPYTDNYLDNPSIPADIKFSFNERFGQRLRGEHTVPVNEQERIIGDLIARIESQYDRSRYPQVYESLLAILRAQGNSIRLLHRNASPYEIDVLKICLEKGGTSVLADGYLVAGSLAPSQAQFLFLFGAFLQLGDDLQDVQVDRRNGLMTVFSQTAGRWPLDTLTNRVFHIGERMVESLNCFDAPGIQPLKELIQMSAVQLIVLAAGQASDLYSSPYIRELETHSPFRFAFLRHEGKNLARHRVELTKLVEAFAASYD